MALSVPYVSKPANTLSVHANGIAKQIVETAESRGLIKALVRLLKIPGRIHSSDFWKAAGVGQEQLDWVDGIIADARRGFEVDREDLRRALINELAWRKL